MLNVVALSPFSHTALNNCLSFMKADDQLVLMQDGVIAASADIWEEKLRNKNIYVMQEDLIARGLVAKVGKCIDMAEYVELVVTHGSPLCW